MALWKESEMKNCMFCICLIFSASAVGADIKPTKQEEKAVMESMMGMMSRLEDPAWLKLMLEGGEGCWLDKDNLIKVGAEAEFSGVPVRCVSWGLGIENKKAYMFFPTRLANQCDKSGKAYNDCIE